MGHPRSIQLVWFIVAAVSIIALFHSMSGNLSTVWISTVKSRSFKSKRHGRISLQEHVNLAEKTVRQRHEMKGDLDDQQSMPFFPAHDAASYEKMPYFVWDFVPASYSCPYEMERIGRMGHGGKWVCGMLLYEAIPVEKPCVIYSFGVQTETSFEDEMLARTHCEVWAYDFSVVDFGKQLNASHRDRAHFEQVGISGDTDTSKDPPFYIIQDLMRQNGHDYLDILKIDIEFAEFASLSSLSYAFPRGAGVDFPIGQMMVELHLFAANGIASGELLTWWEALEARGFRVTWTEQNLLSVILGLEDKNPTLAEYTLLNTEDRRSVLFESLNPQHPTPQITDETEKRGIWTRDIFTEEECLHFFGPGLLCGPGPSPYIPLPIPTPSPTTVRPFAYVATPKP